MATEVKTDWPMKVQGQAAQPVYVVGEHCAYISGEVITMDSSSKPATIPAGTTLIEIQAEAGAVRYNCNAAADANSPGYVPQDMERVFIAANITSFALFGAAPAKAHLLYYKD